MAPKASTKLLNEAMHPTGAVAHLRLARAMAGDGQAVGWRETILKNEVPVLDPAVLALMRTRELLGRRRRLLRSVESANLSDASPEELAQATGILFKDTPEWKTAYLQLKQVLATREHIPQGAEARALRLDRIRMSRTAEHRHRR